MTKIIGLTGGIGSGKTTIAGLFKEMDIPVYIADEEAKKVMQSPIIINAIKNAFGTTVFNGNELIREKLAGIVFNDPEKLKVLNSIVHPAVKEDFKKWLRKQSAFPFGIYESAILFESGNYKDFDVIITVTAPLEIRIERVVKRDNTSREHVLSRINSQWTDEERIAKSDYHIENINLETVKKQIDNILKILGIRQNES